MKGYVTIPKSIYCKPCKQCGERPIITLIGKSEYVVKCPADDLHYQTQPGLIDIEDWNIHNTVLYENG
ncbi:hypothetical protein NAF17_12020 [Mucilaginibacter sp. RB4R14]|uniref:hypothetical protein n=1 Tax=Mucilaginibacter aurantiaciroseus TaxID=2949308 RepID=UPI0020905C0F|nr:hypothetical protein [Mucilaginibacter aurantiaciroseus]MCO5936266.1 hypothetical protein [Mucilaginibacter aurantiaciroseus]